MMAHKFLFDFTQKESLYAEYKFNERAESYLCTSCDKYVRGSYVKNMRMCCVRQASLKVYEENYWANFYIRNIPDMHLGVENPVLILARLLAILMEVFHCISQSVVENGKALPFSRP
jgi:hypothetical protein